MSFTLPGRLQRLDENLHQRLAPWQRQALLLIAFVLLAAPIVGFQALNDRKLSVYDEWQYSDRVHAVTNGNVWMSDGEPISWWGEFTLHCRGIERISESFPGRCKMVDQRSFTPNYAASDPPFYFVATGVAAAVVNKTGLVDDALDAGRLVGILWAGLSMWCLWLLARAFGANRAASFVAASTVVLVPGFLQQYSFITPHALDIPVGAFTALATLKYLRREWPVWVFPIAALTIAGVKGSNIVIAVAIGITLAAVVVWPGVEKRDRVRAFVGGVVLTVSTAVFFVGMQQAVAAAKIADYPPPGAFIKDKLDWWYVFLDSARFITSWGEGPLAMPGAFLVMAMCGTALVAWAGLVPDLGPYVRQLAPGYLLGAVIGAILLDVIVFVTTQQQFGVHLRYGLALFPIGIAFMALLLRTRTAIVLAFLGLVLYAAMPALFSLDSIVA